MTPMAHMDRVTFFRGFLLAMCELGGCGFGVTPLLTSVPFGKMLEYAIEHDGGATPARQIMEDKDPIFGLWPVVQEMVLQGELDFLIVAADGHAKPKLDHIEAGKELDELPRPELFRRLASTYRSHML